MSHSVLDATGAIVGLLEQAGLVTNVGEAPVSMNPPCVVVYPGAGFELAHGMGDPISDMELDFQITCVGVTAEQALWAADKARTAINRATPEVPGQVAWPIQADENAQPVRRDDAIVPPMFVAISRWTLRLERYSMPHKVIESPTGARATVHDSRVSHFESRGFTVVGDAVTNSPDSKVKGKIKKKPAKVTPADATEDLQEKELESL